MRHVEEAANRLRPYVQHLHLDNIHKVTSLVCDVSQDV